MLSTYKVQISQSPHLQEQCEKNAEVGYNFPPLHSFGELYFFWPTSANWESKHQMKPLEKHLC